MGFFKKIKKAIKKAAKQISGVVEKIQGVVSEVPIIGEPLAKVLPYMAGVPGTLPGLLQTTGQVAQVIDDPVGYALGAVEAAETAFSAVATFGASTALEGSEPAPFEVKGLGLDVMAGESPQIQALLGKTSETLLEQGGFMGVGDFLGDVYNAGRDLLGSVIGENAAKDLEEYVFDEIGQTQEDLGIIGESLAGGLGAAIGGPLGAGAGLVLQNVGQGLLGKISDEVMGDAPNLPARIPPPVDWTPTLNAPPYTPEPGDVDFMGPTQQGGDQMGYEVALPDVAQLQQKMKKAHQPLLRYGGYHYGWSEKYQRYYWMPNRRMNPLNVRALHRGLRRARTFKRIASHVVTLTKGFKKGKGRKKR